MSNLEQFGNIDYLKVFESTPDLYLLLSPGLVIIDASNAYLSATLTERNNIIGRDLFEVFPDNPGDQIATGVFNLSASLQYVLQYKVAHTMAVQKYDIRRPDGIFEERYWSPKNTPVLDEKNDVLYIIHRVEDVTEAERMKTEALHQQMRNTELETAQKIHIEDLRKSQDRFFKIFNLSPISLYMTEVETGKMIYANKAFEQLFLIKIGDAIGKTTIELNITDTEKRSNTIKKILENEGKVSNLETELRIATGEMKKMLMSVELIELDSINYFLVSILDIHERKKMEEALMQTNRFLDTILENIPNMVFVKDAVDLRFIRFNKAGENLLGYSREDLNGKNDYDFFPKEQADFFTAKDRDVFQQKEMLEIEEEPINTKYGEKWLHTKKIPVFDNGKPAFLVGISEDISEQKKQKNAIINLNKELEAFSYTVSHDLRAPLRAVNGYARMLNEDYSGVLDAEGKRLLGIICSNAEKMGRLIDDLLSFSRLGKKELQKNKTDMMAIAESIVSEYLADQGCRATITINHLHSIQSDPGLMKQVMINLISNAVKYSSTNEHPVITISSEEDDNNIIFSVKDNGVGFDMRYVNKLFGVFQRLHTDEEFEGTGVGLAIVKRIIHKHAGKVWATGEVNKGASIYFSIPK